MSGIYDAVQNPIPHSGLFATGTLDEVQEYIERLPKKDRAQAYLIMWLTLNSCHELVEKKILSREIFAV